VKQYVDPGRGSGGIGRLDCVLDGNLLQACSTNPTFSGLSEGDHTLDVIALDKAGNQTAVHKAWTVDITKPAVTLTAPTSLVTLTSTATVSWTGSDADGIHSCW